MSTFLYEAYNRDGVIVRGEYEGISRDEVVGHLSRRDLTPISIEALRGHGGRGGLSSISLFERIGPVDIMFLVRSLATTVKAGLSIVESLDILIADAEKNAMKRILQKAQAIIKNGQPLSLGFEEHKHLFPTVFIGMLKAGELSGQLDRTLAELGKYLSKEYALRSKIRAALMYPIILLVASAGVVALLLIFVLPRLTKAFAASEVALPWVTRFFLGISSVLTWSFTADLVVLVALAWFFLYFRTTRIGKAMFTWIVARLPVANELVKKVSVVRFARTFGNLINSGLSAVESLELSAESIGSQNYARAIRAAIADIKNGMSISSALAKFPDLFPHLLISLIVVGERTGSLHDILTTFADFYEEEVDNKLKELTSVLEPLLLLIMGVMVGSIAFSIILPIYQLVGHFV